MMLSTRIPLKEGIVAITGLCIDRRKLVGVTGLSRKTHSNVNRGRTECVVAGPVKLAVPVVFWDVVRHGEELR